MFGLLSRKLKPRKPEVMEAEMLIVVYGNTEGSITGANKVIVGSTGCCKSNIKADQLDVAGEVDGDVDVRELVIRGQGRIHGRIKYEKLTLLEDAVFSPDNNGNKERTIKKPRPTYDSQEQKQGPSFTTSF